MKTVQPFVSEDSLSWYALYTKPRQEDRAAENLSAWGVSSLSPKMKARGGSSFFAPLFPGYIFARFDVNTMLGKIRFTRGISHIVSFGGQPAALANEIVDAIRSRIDSKGIVKQANQFQPGDAVVIHSGPMRDFEGVFEGEISSSERVRILLKAVAYSARVEVFQHEISKATGVSNA
jgi:transcriptional antiterminator RfaH